MDGHRYSELRSGKAIDGSVSGDCMTCTICKAAPALTFKMGSFPANLCEKHQGEWSRLQHEAKQSDPDKIAAEMFNLWKVFTGRRVSL